MADFERYKIYLKKIKIDKKTLKVIDEIDVDEYEFDSCNIESKAILRLVMKDIKRGFDFTLKRYINSFKKFVRKNKLLLTNILSLSTPDSGEFLNIVNVNQSMPEHIEAKFMIGWSYLTIDISSDVIMIQRESVAGRNIKKTTVSLSDLK